MSGGEVARKDGMTILLPPAALGPEDGQYLEGWCDGQQYLILNTPDAAPTPPAAASEVVREAIVRAYFERGFIAAAAWVMTKRDDAKLSDDVIEHAWAHRDEGMDAEDMLPTPTATHNAEALREALAPFARQNPHKNEDGATGILVPATVADVRRARSALDSAEVK